MAGIVDITILLKEMKPVLDMETYVFCTVPEQALTAKWIALQPIATFVEAEGITLVVSKVIADTHRLSYEGVYRKITLEVHSSLEAVGLTAAFSTALTKHGISANVMAGYYHDHIFVPEDKAELAVKVLKSLAKN